MDDAQRVPLPVAQADHAPPPVLRPGRRQFRLFSRLFRRRRATGAGSGNEPDGARGRAGNELPPGWETCLDSNGRTIYMNEETRAYTTQRPTTSITASGRSSGTPTGEAVTNLHMFCQHVIKYHALCTSLYL